ncbi:MAG: conjugal transfer protein TraX [Bacilli bacterium]|nr:conjugal transfer protein TraX [Bacilli bacterium]
MKRLQINQTVLRIIAFVTMACDHLGVCLLMFPPMTWEHYALASDIALALRSIGRIALPIFLFMTAEGVRKTSNKWRYLGRIAAIWAPIALVEFAGSLYLGAWNYLPAQAMTEILLYVLFACFITEKGWKKIFAALPVAYCVFSFIVDLFTTSGYSTFHKFPMFLLSDYDIYGIVLFLGFMLVYPIYDLLAKKFSDVQQISVEEYKNSEQGRKMVNNLSIIIIVLVAVIFWIFANLFEGAPFGGTYIAQYHIETYSVISCIFIYFYNGQRGLNGKVWKWVSYLFYPVHFVILLGIFALIFGI